MIKKYEGGICLGVFDCLLDGGLGKRLLVCLEISSIYQSVISFIFEWNEVMSLWLGFDCHNNYNSCGQIK